MYAIKTFSEFVNEGKTSGFNRTYTMSSTWWALWKTENKEKFTIKQDSFTKTFEVFTKDKEPKLSFVFDYGRNVVFTNDSPKQFELKRIDPEAKAKAEETDAETGKKEVLPGEGDKKEKEAEGELATDKTEEEE